MEMDYLTSREVKQKGLNKFREVCGTYDYVTFLEASAVTDYMVTENKQLGYIGLSVIVKGRVIKEVFFQTEDEIQQMKDSNGFDWDMSPEEKAMILEEYCVY
jgi:hypothetical protein